MVFYGEYTVSVTEGGRLVIPKKIRENLKGDVFVLTKGFNTYLAGYDKDDWEKRSSEFLTASLIETENLDRKRLLFAGANYISIDEQGRFVIPKALLEFVGTASTVTIIGVGDHFELWEGKKWRQYAHTSTFTGGD